MFARVQRDFHKLRRYLADAASRPGALPLCAQRPRSWTPSEMLRPCKAHISEPLSGFAKWHVLRRLSTSPEPFEHTSSNHCLKAVLVATPHIRGKVAFRSIRIAASHLNQTAPGDMANITTQIQRVRPETVERKLKPVLWLGSVFSSLGPKTKL